MWSVCTCHRNRIQQQRLSPYKETVCGRKRLQGDESGGDGKREAVAGWLTVWESVEPQMINRWQIWIQLLGFNVTFKFDISTVVAVFNRSRTIKLFPSLVWTPSVQTSVIDWFITRGNNAPLVVGRSQWITVVSEQTVVAFTRSICGCLREGYKLCELCFWSTEVLVKNIIK